MAQIDMIQKATSYLALFTSAGTLLCCALPSAIAAVAGGTAVVSFITAFPWLIPLSRHKDWIFVAAGVMIVLSAALIYRPKGRLACSITGGRGCELAGRFSLFTFWISAGIFTVGVFFAYLIVPLMDLLEA